MHVGFKDNSKRSVCILSALEVTPEGNDGKIKRGAGNTIFLVSHHAAQLPASPTSFR